MGEIVMSKKDQKMYDQAIQVICKRLSIQEFAELNSLSYRQSQRIIKKVKSKGMKGVKHGNLGKIPHNKTPSELELDILSLLKGKYYDFNLTHFKEMIHVHEGIEIGKNVIHRIAKTNGLIKRPKRRLKKKVHKLRPRMPQEGMLIQFDGSQHVWFGGFESDLIAGIDDATGKVLGAEFFIGETSLNCMKVMKEIIQAHGVPHAFYLDKAGAFGKDDRDKSSTQIGRALTSIGSDIILANSPQAKGKIERLWDTLQDRLIAELRFYEIKTVPSANKFLREDFLPRFNQNFSYPARSSQKAYLECIDNLDNIFCMKENRKITTGNTFSWNSQVYIIQGERNYRFRTININTHYDGHVSFDILGKAVEVKAYKSTPRNLGLAA